jgi:hypothetical protein
MDPVTTADLLTAWERGSSQPGSRRLLTLLATVHPELSEEQLLKLSIGQRDGLVLRLRELLFGSQLTSLTACPVCSEQLELALDVSDIRVASIAPAPERLMLNLEGFDPY